MSADRRTSRSRAHRQAGGPAESNGIVLIKSSNLTRVVLRHAPCRLERIPIEFDCTLTVDSQFEIEDVQMRLLQPRSIEISWPAFLRVSVDGVRRNGVITAQARRRISKALVRLLFEGDLGTELP